MFERSEGRIRVVTSAKKDLRSICLICERLRAGEGEQLLGQPGAALRRVADAVEHPLDLVGIADVAQRELAGAEDRGQQIVEIVRQAAGELPERLHLLRPEQLLARFLQPLLRLALLGHVAGDLGEADQLAVFVADRVDHHARPEAGAVLADAPALRFVAAGLPRGLERAVRDSGVEILGRVEAAEMLADDVFGRIALDPLGAGIPVGHPAFGVEHVDGIIGDALDQDPEAPLGLEQRLLRLALLGHVAGDLGEADQLAVVAVDPVDDDACPKA